MRRVTSKQWLWLFLITGFLVVLFVPFTFERVPECKFLIVDAENKPIAKVRTVQVLTDHTFREYATNYQYSDDNGYAAFPRITVWGSVAYVKIFRPLFAELMTLAHQSTGLSARMHVDDPDYYATSSVTWSGESVSGEPLPVQLSAMKRNKEDKIQGE